MNKIRMWLTEKIWPETEETPPVWKLAALIIIAGIFWFQVITAYTIIWAAQHGKPKEWMKKLEEET